MHFKCTLHIFFITFKLRDRGDDDDEADFVCRKGFHAINVQAVADDSLRYDFLWFILDGSNSNVEERTFIFVICP